METSDRGAPSPWSLVSLSSPGHGSPPADIVEPTKAQMRQMDRFGDPDEVARAALFLVFEATITTGAELPIDGGVSQLL